VLIITRLIPLGGISYALYIIHFPLLSILNQITAFSNSPSLFIARLLLFLAASFAAAYMLDKKFQPWVKRSIERLTA
jgi:peptidoglycan/LPS O-acetylase OafA/YrhL